MTGVLAIDPDFGEVRVGARAQGEERGLALATLGADDDPFAWYLATFGADPSVVAIAGGSYAQCPPGAYAVDSRMAADASRIDSWHPRNRMTVRAFELCSATGIPCLALDPMSSADIMVGGKFSGFPRYERRGVYYAVPQRRAFRKTALSLGLDPLKAAVVSVYLGNEAVVTAHRGERILDTSDPVACEGPFGLMSAGTVPATAFVSWLGREGRPAEEVLETLKKASGVFAYAGVSSMAELITLLADGDRRARAAVLGMAYQVSKEIGREMAALEGECSAVVLTGPGASLPVLTSLIEARVSKWCRVVRIEEDLAIPALIEEGIRAISSKSLQLYPGEKRY